METVGEQVPETWRVTLSGELSPAVINLLDHGKTVTLDTIMRDPANRDQTLPLVPLLLSRDGESILLPDPSMPLEIGDLIMFCGKHLARSSQALTLTNRKVLTYVLDGTELPDGLVWRWIYQRRSKP